ncbi:MAG TPA: 2-amino-4-hydroxy-6-hydroxymethyldihydropteridine diphosphokinase [Vicinamibacterales bacterium]
MTEAAPVEAAVAIGSNLGDRHAAVAQALERLAPLLEGLRAAPPVETAPVGVDEPQPDFLNTVAIGRTRLPPRALLDALLGIELALGRTRPYRLAPRVIDLDLILYGEAIVDEPGLQIPHPRFRERLFVLDPLADLVPDWVDPVTGLTVRALRDRARSR